MTSDGLEKDLVLSALSRIVFLRELVPRMKASGKAGQRIFVWGMPGGGQPANTADPNFERTKYVAGFANVHSNTVAANEALVLKLAPELKASGISVYGVNPGLLSTNIRKSARPLTCFEFFFENVIIAGGVMNE